MAKNVKTTETALSSGNVKVPGMGHNQPPSSDDGFPKVVTGWSVSRAKQLAHAGFDDTREASKLHGRAEQRVIASIFVCFAEWHANGYVQDAGTKDAVAVDTPKLSDMISRTGKATDDILAMRGRLMSELFEFKTAWKNEDEKAEYEKGKTAAQALINRALSSAAILFKNGLTIADYNEKLNCFAVFPPMVTPPDATPIGALRNETVKIMLDNRFYMIMRKDAKGNEKADKVQASVKQINDIWKAKEGIKRPGRKPVTPADDDKKSGETAANALRADTVGQFVADSNDHHANLGAAIKAIYQRLEADAAHWRFASMPEDVWNAAEKLAALIGTITSRPNFRPPVGATAKKAA